MSEKEKKVRELSAEEVLQKFDKESDKRELTGVWGKIISAICILFALFQLYTATFGVLDAHLQRAIHLAFGFLLIFLLYPSRHSWSRSKMHPFDAFLALLSAGTAMYLVVNYQELVLRAGMNTETDFIVGLIGTIMVFEAARRVVGWPMIIVAFCFMLYAFLGPYVPGILAHRGVGVQEMFDHLFFTTEGIFGTPMGVSSTFIYLFILFGAYLETTGLGKFFIDIANAIAGWAAGGPAKVAVLSSGLMGTVSGSSVGNVAGTGAFTIPMMKKMGYSPEFSASVEAIASTGGMIMPPIMGASAMIMAEFLGVPYVTIMKAALIPALLYYFAIWMVVDLEARRLNLKTMPKGEAESAISVIRKRGYMLLPIILLIILMVSGKTPLFSSFYAIVAALLLSSIKKETRLDLTKFADSLEDASRLAIPVASSCASVGIMVAMTGATGLGMVLGDGLIKLAHGNFYLTLVFSMLTCIVLGMGLPTSACYIVVSTIAAPALLKFGISGIPVHMFAFYFGILSVLTPPVCTASLTAAGIAGANPNRTGYKAFSMAAAGFLIPYIFMLSPQLLLIDATFLDIITKLPTAMVGTACLAVAIVGYIKTSLNVFERIGSFAAGVLLMDGGILTDMIGLALIAVIFLLDVMRNKKKTAVSSAPVEETTKNE